MNKSLPILMLFLSVFSYAQDSFKDKFAVAYGHLEHENYQAALPILLEMHEMQPSNANVNFSIGNCFMNTANEKVKAIPYFESAQEDLTVAYRIGNPKEKKAPVEVIRLLGQAYHVNYEFDKAIEQYTLYKSLLDENNEDGIREISRDIRISNNAIQLKENPIEIYVRSVEMLNTEYPEYRPKVNAEETVMFFTTRRKETDQDLVDEEGKYFENVYMSVKEFGKWGPPVKLGDIINTNSHDACLYISPDAELMYVYRFEETDDTDGSIFEVRKEGEEWGKPVKMDAAINSPYWETDASLNSYGNTIFFTSDRPGGNGDRDIWMMRKLPNGQWADAENLGGAINTRYDEESPYLHPDGKTLYFSSKGHNTMGGFDVFKSELQEDGTWSAAENIGYPINTTGDDVFYFPSTDGKRAYFSSYRGGGKGDQDIYVMTLEEEKEKSLAIYKGIAKDTLGNIVKDILITIVDEETGEEIGEYRPNSITGKFLFILQPGHDYEIQYDLDGVLASETISVGEDGGVQDLTKIIIDEGDKLSIWAGKVEDGEIVELAKAEDDVVNVDITDVEVTLQTNAEDDKQKVEEILARQDSINDGEPISGMTQDQVDQVLDEGGTVILDGVLFKYDQVNIIDQSKDDLEKMVTYMQKNPGAKLLITGHTDANGTGKYNMWLSSARANKIRRYIARNGDIAYDRMIAKYFGESRPIAPNQNEDGSDNPEGRQKNRRVEFTVIK